MAIAAGIAALFALVATLLLVRRVTKPLNAVADTLTVLAEGRTDVEVQYADRHDEIGVIARTVDIFKNNRIERNQLEAERLNAEKAAMEQRKAELNQFVEAFRTKIGGIIEQVLNSSRQFRKGYPAAFDDGAFDGRDVRAIRRRIQTGFRACPQCGNGLRRTVAIDH